MQVAGIICEYNPLHLGHQKQIRLLKAQGYAVVCLMSGIFVQRGHPAIFHKMRRAQAAVECGATPNSEAGHSIAAMHKEWLTFTLPQSTVKSMMPYKK